MLQHRIPKNIPFFSYSSIVPFKWGHFTTQSTMSQCKNSIIIRFWIHLLINLAKLDIPADQPCKHKIAHLKNNVKGFNPKYKIIS